MRPTLQSQGCKDIQDFLEKFGAESFARTSNQHYFSMIYFFAGLAMNNPKFRVLQRELTQEYLGLMGSAFKALAQVPVSDERIIELVSFMAIVLDGIASHRIMFDDPQRMTTKVWQLVVATIRRSWARAPPRSRVRATRQERRHSADCREAEGEYVVADLVAAAADAAAGGGGSFTPIRTKSPSQD